MNTLLYPISLIVQKVQSKKSILRSSQELVDSHYHFGCKQSCIFLVVEFSKYFPQHGSVPYEFSYSPACMSWCDVGEVLLSDLCDLHDSVFFAHIGCCFGVINDVVRARVLHVQRYCFMATNANFCALLWRCFCICAAIIPRNIRCRFS